jgi:hypothetical protein
MDIESLIPKEVEDRDAYIKNVVFDKIKDCKIGLDFTDIFFKFKTDIPPYPDKINFIEVDGIELHNFGGDSVWDIVSDNPRDFLPKEYLLKEWKVW